MRSVRWVAVGLLVHRAARQQHTVDGDNVYAWHFWENFDDNEDSARTALKQFGDTLGSADTDPSPFLIGNVAEHLFRRTRTLDWVLRLEVLASGRRLQAFACVPNCKSCKEDHPKYVQYPALGNDASQIIDDNKPGWDVYLSLVTDLSRTTGSDSIWYCPIPSFQRLAREQELVLDPLLGGGLIVSTRGADNADGRFVSRLASLQAAHRSIVGELRIAAPEIGSSSSKADAIAAALTRAHEENFYKKPPRGGNGNHDWKDFLDTEGRTLDGKPSSQALDKLSRVLGLNRGAVTEENARDLHQFGKAMTCKDEYRGFHPSVFSTLLTAIGVKNTYSHNIDSEDLETVDKWKPIVPAMWVEAHASFVDKIAALRALLGVLEAVQNHETGATENLISTWHVRFWVLPSGANASTLGSIGTDALQKVALDGDKGGGLLVLEFVPHDADGISNALPRVAADTLAGREGNCATAFKALGRTKLVSMASGAHPVPAIRDSQMFTSTQLKNMLDASRSSKMTIPAQIVLYGGRLLLVQPAVQGAVSSGKPGYWADLARAVEARVSKPNGGVR